MSRTRRTTQQQLVLNHLLSYGSLTSRKAFDTYGITRLADVIFKLKKKLAVHDEYQIETSTMSSVNRYGVPVQYAVYRIKQK